MLHREEIDPIIDNPFSRLGLNGLALKNKSVNEAVSLARAAVRVYRSSTHLNERDKRKFSATAEMLSDPEMAERYLKAIAGLTPDQVLQEASKRYAVKALIADTCCKLSFEYQIDSVRPSSIMNAIRLAPAELKVIDYIALLQSELDPSHQLAEKLFTKKITCSGNSILDGGVTSPLEGQFHKRSIGVLTFENGGKRLTPKDFRDFLNTLGLVNAPSHSLELHDLSQRPSRLIQKRDPGTHPIFSHFHPIEALDRLLLVDKGPFKAKFTGRIPQDLKNNSSILISEVSFGTSNGICIEGVLLSVEPTAITKDQVKSQIKATPKSASKRKPSSSVKTKGQE